MRTTAEPKNRRNLHCWMLEYEIGFLICPQALAAKYKNGFR